jgi:hypothetical protein
MADTPSVSPTTPQPATSTPTATDTAKIGAAAGTGAASKVDDPGKTASNEKDPMRELLDRMDRLRALVAPADSELARTMQKLSQRGVDAEQRSQPGFRTAVAYALQDVENFHVGRLDLPPQLRREMTQLAGSAVGLENERLQALMQATASMQDRALIREIRAFSADIARRADQKNPDVESRVDVIENKVRLTGRPPEPTTSAPSAASQNATEAPAGEPRATPSRPPGPTLNAGSDRPANGPAFGAPPQGDIRYSAGPQAQAPVTVQHSVLDTLLRAMRPSGNQPSAPWEPPPTPMGSRIDAAERRGQAEKDDRAFVRAEAVGKAALDALNGFANGEAAAVMSRINAAAKTEPGGLPQVLSEMREGGRFADLRKQFGNALADDAGVAAAYDKAASSLAAYGKTRSDVEGIISRRPDANALTQRFEQIDAEIGKAASNTPSKTEGRSMMDDLAKQAAELLQRAVDAVSSAFARSPTANATASAAPSPSPSP